MCASTLSSIKRLAALAIGINARADTIPRKVKKHRNFIASFRLWDPGLRLPYSSLSFYQKTSFLRPRRERVRLSFLLPGVYANGFAPFVTNPALIRSGFL